MRLAACWAVWSVLLLVALVARVRSRSWFAPAALFPTFWTGAVGVPLLLAPQFDVWPASVAYIALLAFTFSLAALAGQRQLHAAQVPAARLEPRVEPGRVASHRLLRLSLWGATGAGLIATLIVMRALGRSPVDLLSLQGIMELGAEASEARYHEGFDAPLPARLMSIGFYYGPLAGAVLWTEARRRTDRVLAVLPMVAALTFVMVMTSRAVLLFSGLLFFSTRFALAVYRREERSRRVGVRRFFITVGTVVVAFVFFVAAQMIRGGVDDLSRVGEVVEHLTVWFFGHLPGFSRWMADMDWVDGKLSLGEYTFGGLFQLIGLGKREMGIYGYVPIGGGRETNVFSALRGLVMDFGPVGAVGVVALLGYSAGASHRHVRRGNILAIPALTAAYGFTLWSHVASIATYNTIIVAFAGFALLVLHRASRHVPGTRIARGLVHPRPTQEMSS